MALEINETRKAESTVKGIKGEAKFYRILEKKRLAGEIKDIRKATESEDRYDKADFFVTFYDDVPASSRVGEMVIYQVKSECKDGDFIWAEWKNIGGGIGWLYGRADYIAFEVGPLFYIVSRRRLLQYVERVVFRNEVVFNKSEATFWNIYQRKDWDRKDEITKVSLYAIQKICSEIWEEKA